MEPWLNSDERKAKEWAKVYAEEAAEEIGAFGKPTKDIFGFIKDHAPLKPWQQDIMSMLYEESMYFAPQRMTKMLNEGWASFIDYTTMCRMGLVSLGQESHDNGIFEYAKHKMGVLGGKYSMNPYKLGFMLMLDIEERWNKGRFGDEWENCQDAKLKENWDTQTNLGTEKVFEVRKCYNDLTAIMEFFTDEFCEKNEFFEYKTYPNGEIKIETRNPAVIRSRLIKRYTNGGLPDIKLADHNHLGQGWMCLEHSWDDRPLYDPYVRHTLASIYYFWQKPIVLATRTRTGEEFVYVCESDNHKEVATIPRDEYEARVGKMRFREKVK
jgi:stage V sporulation protein R